MPITIPLDRDQGEDVVRAAGRSWRKADIRFLADGASPSSLPTKMLKSGEQSFFVERPVGPDGPVDAVAGVQAVVTFSLPSRRFQVETTIRGRRQIEFAPGTRIDAIELSLPHRVSEIQRRADYRVPLWSAAPVIAQFEPLPVGGAHDDFSAEAYQAELQNISVGGVAALVDATTAPHLKAGQTFRMTFSLPGREEVFNFIVRVQHIRPMKHVELRLIGLKFLPGDDAQVNRQAIQTIRSFVEVHRRMRSAP